MLSISFCLKKINSKISKLNGWFLEGEKWGFPHRNLSLKRKILMCVEVSSCIFFSGFYMNNMHFK